MNEETNRLIKLFGNTLIITNILTAAIAPQQKIRLAYDYPTNELSTNLTFKLYESTNLNTPLNEWKVLTNVIGTNTYIDLLVVPGQHFFALTSSNMWGESPFSNIASTPNLPRSLTNLTIQKID